MTKTERDEERFDEERLVHPSDAYLLINPNLTLCLFFIIGYSIYFIFEGKKDKISRQKRLSFCHFHYFWIGYAKELQKCVLRNVPSVLESEFIVKSPQIVKHKMDFYAQKRLVRSSTLSTLKNA